MSKTWSIPHVDYYDPGWRGNIGINGEQWTERVVEAMRHVRSLEGYLLRDHINLLTPILDEQNTVLEQRQEAGKYLKQAVMELEEAMDNAERKATTDLNKERTTIKTLQTNLDGRRKHIAELERKVETVRAEGEKKAKDVQAAGEELIKKLTAQVEKLKSQAKTAKARRAKTTVIKTAKKIKTKRKK